MSQLKNPAPNCLVVFQHEGRVREQSERLIRPTRPDQAAFAKVRRLEATGRTRSRTRTDEREFATRSMNDAVDPCAVSIWDVLLFQCYVSNPQRQARSQVLRFGGKTHF